MITIHSDTELDQINAPNSVQELARFISLLTGQPIDASKLSAESLHLLDAFLARVKKDGENKVEIGHEEFNELLLLFNQQRVTRAFFTFFFLNKDPCVAPEYSKAFVTFDQLKAGIRRVRGYAMLKSGNFRFAFQRLSEVEEPHVLLDRLDPWCRHAPAETSALCARRAALTRPTSQGDVIDGDATWLLGYLSSEGLNSDGKALEKITEATRGAPNATTKQSVEAYRIAKDNLAKLRAEQNAARAMGKRNSVTYLTWDYVDVYVATSMRHFWEYEETHRFLKEVFSVELKDLPTIRHFDPTQSYCDSVIDKGLIESLMLKRARCTIYMAQDGDTLGKDSELAATLAQGKPVVAYVPQIRVAELGNYVKDLERRSIGYFKKKLHTLLADGFFDKPDNRERVTQLAKNIGFAFESAQAGSEAYNILELVREFEKTRRFQIIGDEEGEFRKGNSERLEKAARFLAAVESVAMDNRAETIRRKHPLSMQVHLETGVANGVLVARNARECAHLVRGVLTSSLSFDIKPEPETAEPIATVLIERETGSRFRVVTLDECLTNSFWNFYLGSRERDART